MESIEHEDSGEHTAEAFADHSLSLDLPGTNNFDEVPLVPPRVGDRYQVEIPSLTTELEHLRLRPSLHTDDKLGVDDFTGIGLPVPIMWVHHVGDHMKQEEFAGTNLGTLEAAALDSRNNKESCTNANCSIASGYPPERLNHHGKLPQGIESRVEFSGDLSDHGKELAGPTSQECTALDDLMNMDFPSLQLGKAVGFIPLPGLPATHWSDAEAQSFLLGLYIFGKNLVQVKKFIECKEMGDLLAYYYGKFYRSDTHRRWLECRKIRSRRCIHGQRIFTDRRQQELLSRLLPSMSQDAQDTLQEATKRFNEGRASLEEYVFTVKAAVGMQALVEAVAIGKGKHDLTGISLDPVRTNQVSTRPEIPIGKACSTLTSEDIVKFLRGDFRLSKARSNDLFWEAVWPRLLARGWHSEQPKNLGFLGPKHGLVFLVPGIKKFSRKKLVKGNHYFDSVRDVLNKVAADPGLLELEVEGGAKGSGETKDEHGWDVDPGPDHHQRHCYLRPRLANSELMKFTVVDTSLAQGEGPFRVRELRSLPRDVVHSYGGPSTPSGETASNSSEEKQDSADTPSDSQGDRCPGSSDDKKPENSKRKQSGLADNVVTVSKSSVLVNGHDSNIGCLDLVNGKKPVKDIKQRFSRRVKSGQPDHLAALSKRRRLTSCNQEGTGQPTCSFPRGPELKEEEAICELEAYKASDIVGQEVRPSLGRMSANSSARSSPERSCEYILTGNFYGASTISEVTISEEKPQPRALIDLNLPVLGDFDTDDPWLVMEVSGHDSKQEESPYTMESKQQSNGDSQVKEAPDHTIGDLQPSASTRRQSTRNRPPTTKALEALACGFLGTKKGRGAKRPPSSRLAKRPSQRRLMIDEAPSPTIPDINPAAFSSDIRDSDVGINELYGSDGNPESMFIKSHAQSERKGSHELLGVP